MKLKTLKNLVSWPRKRAIYFEYNGHVYKDNMKLKGKPRERVFFEIGPEGYIEISIGNLFFRSLSFYFCQIDKAKNLIIGN